MVYRIYGTALPRDKNKDPSTIYHSKIDPVYAKMHYLYII